MLQKISVRDQLILRSVPLCEETMTKYTIQTLYTINQTARLFQYALASPLLKLTPDPFPSDSAPTSREVLVISSEPRGESRIILLWILEALLSSRVVTMSPFHFSDTSQSSQAILRLLFFQVVLHQLMTGLSMSPSLTPLPFRSVLLSFVRLDERSRWRTKVLLGHSLRHRSPNVSALTLPCTNASNMTRTSSALSRSIEYTSCSVFTLFGTHFLSLSRQHLSGARSTCFTPKGSPIAQRNLNTFSVPSL